MDTPGRHDVSYSALPKGALGLAICVQFFEISLDMKREELEETFLKTILFQHKGILRNDTK